MKLQFNSDLIKIIGPRADGGYTISFSVGEYQQQEVMLVGAIPQRRAVKVTIEASDQTSD